MDFLVPCSFGTLICVQNMKKNAKKLVTVIAVASLATGLWFSFRGVTPSCWIADRLVPPLVPTRLSLADFQTDADKDLMKWLSEADDSPLTKVADEHLVKPLSDDVRTRMLAIQG